MVEANSPKQTNKINTTFILRCLIKSDKRMNNFIEIKLN
jgi:hypothetical protein